MENAAETRRQGTNNHTASTIVSLLRAVWFPRSWFCPSIHVHSNHSVSATGTAETPNFVYYCYFVPINNAVVSFMLGFDKIFRKWDLAI
jgi:hypothetical protein